MARYPQPSAKAVYGPIKATMGYKLVREMNERQLPAPEKAVWKALGDHASDADGGGAWPNQETLAQETGYKVRQIRNILRKLEARGAIVETRKPGRRTSREYRIVLDWHLRPAKIAALDGVAVEVKTGNFDNQDRQFVHQERQSTTLKTGKDCRQTLIESSLNPNKENPPKTHARESRDIDIDSGLARESMPMVSEPESLKKEDHRIFRKGVDDIPVTVAVIQSDEVQRKREARKALLLEQKRQLESRAKISMGT